MFHTRVARTIHCISQDLASFVNEASLVVVPLSHCADVALIVIVDVACRYSLSVLLLLLLNR